MSKLNSLGNVLLLRKFEFEFVPFHEGFVDGEDAVEVAEEDELLEYPTEEAIDVDAPHEFCYGEAAAEGDDVAEVAVVVREEGLFF